ncbi:MAG: hypothetical protein EOM28_01045 [Clostridia bacterium]|nr:hypothetical protein [Clostridia bacterium]
MNQTIQIDDTRDRVSDEELIGVLTAISVVSKRLARKLSILAGQSQSKEGEKANEQNERIGRRNCGPA